MKMTKLTGIFILLFLTLNLSAQQLPVYNLYTQNRILVNPANTADQGGLSGFLGSRNQWVGIHDAPKTISFGIQGLVRDNMGLGGYLISDRSGLIERLSINLCYAYMVKLSDDHKLTFGLNGIINENQFLMGNAVVRDMNDNLLSLSSSEGMRFDAGFGFKYNWKRLETGLSVPYLFQSKVRYFTTDNNDYIFDFYRHYNLFVSYLFTTGNAKWDIEPSIVYRDAINSPSQVDLNLTGRWDDKCWLGFGYRNSEKTSITLTNKAFIISGGLTIKENIDLGYAYEMSNSAIYSRTNGTHELMISYTFGGGRKDDVYNDLIQQLKKNQTELLTRLDTVDSKLNTTKKNAEKMAATNIKQDEKINDLAAEIQKLRKDMNESDKKSFEKISVIPTGESKSVYFKTGSYELSEEARSEIKKFVVMAQSNTNMINVIGYADDVGDSKMNLVLSENRAKAVSQFLTENGINDDRISLKYYGEQQRTNVADLEAVRALQRRVDMILLQ